MLNHSGPPRQGVAAVVLLDIKTGDYFFWPSWRHYPSDIDYTTIDVTAGLRDLPIISEFVWPSGVGAAANLSFYAALLDPALTQLLTEVAEWDFGYGE